MGFSSPVRLLGSLALLGGGLGVVSAPGPAAGVDVTTPYPFTSENLTLFKVPAFPASLITTGGRGVFDTLTLNAVVSQEYGLTTNDPSQITDELRHTWAHDEPYGPLNETDAQAGADDVAVGDLDFNGTSADPKVNAAYLVRGDVGGADQLVLTGDQSQGFPLIGTSTIPGGALSLAITEKSGAVPALLYVRYADALKAYKYDASAAGRLTAVPLTVSGLGAAALSGVADIYHRPTWLDPAIVDNPLDPPGFDAASRAGSLAIAHQAANLTGGTDLRSDLLVPSGTATAVTLSPLVVDLTIGGQHTLAGGASNQAWQSGEVRYVWAPKAAGGLGGSQDRFAMAVTGRRAGANQVAVYRTSLGIGLNPVTTTVNDTNPCGDDEAVDLDLAQFDEVTIAVCASIDHVTGANDRLVEGVVRSTGTFTNWSTHGGSHEVAGAESLRQPQVRVELSCQWLNNADPDPTKHCSDSSNAIIADAAKNGGNVALLTTVAAGDNSSSLATAYQTSNAFLDVAPSTVNTSGLFWWSRVSGDPVPVNSPFPLLSAPLPTTDNLVKAHVPNDPVTNPPEHVTSKPIPVAFLPAPPEVAGAGQQGDAPEFASVSRSTNGNTTSTSTSVSATLGAEIEDVTGAYGVSFDATLSNEVSDDTTVEKTVQTAQAFRGLEDDNVVVYRRVPITRWNGTITESSTGIGIGQPTSVDLPDGNVVTTATNVGALAAQYPELYGPGGELKPVLDKAFSNTVGDPGS
jgi:hypothetical protein